MLSSCENSRRQVISNIVEKDNLYRELWQACAGKLFYIPKQGDQVIYLPQPHIEEVRAYADPDDLVDVPHNLPPAIHCSVANVELMAEAETDEVIAGLTLVPQQEGVVIATRPDCRNVSRVRLYSKTLTASDVSTHGGYTIPKPQAEGLLPPLNATEKPATQSVAMYDLHGKKWIFRHKLRGNPKRHLFSTGWSKFLEAKRLIKGDTLVYLRGENGELRVGVRRSTKSESRASAMASIVSGQSLQFGVLASVAHAVHTKSMFSVYCRPWRNCSSFVVPLHQYLNSMKNDYSDGARFKMCFENDECVERRFKGRIDSNEDLDPVRWPGSKWKCLKVTWDVPTNMHCPKPERVSPWEIELVSSDKRKEVHIEFERKKPFQPNLGFQGGSSAAYSDPGWIPYCSRSSQAASAPEYQGPSFHGALRMGPSPGFGLRYRPKFHDIEPKFLNPQRFKSFTLFGKNIVGTPWVEELPSLANADHHTPSPSAHPSPQPCAADNLGDIQSSSRQQEQACDKGCQVQVANADHQTPSPSAHPSPQPCAADNLGDIQSSSRQQEQACDKGCQVQVIKYTTTSISRFINLSEMSGYDDLILEIDAMFDFSGSLRDGSSEWHMTYVDADGFDVLVGDCMWNEFLSAVKRIDICPKDHTHGGPSGGTA